jgi:hypothetical protein
MNILRYIALLVLVVLPLAPVIAADGFVYLNVSIKFILHPADGLRPRVDRNNPATRITDDQINASITDANRFLASYGRGYRLRVVELLDIGGLNQNHDNQPRTKPGYYAIQSTKANLITFYYPSGYVNPDGQSPTTGPLIDVLDQNARSTATTKLDFKWNDYAVNVFVPSDWAGGGGISPDWGDAAGFGVFEGWLFLHELGHYYNLIHTFGEDGVADTLVDPALAADSQDAIAQLFYGKNYNNCTAAEQAVVNTEYYLRNRNNIAAANNTPPNDVLSSSTYSLLPASEQEMVDDVFFNIMSYYDPPRRNQFVTRMTEGQADRLADAANSSRHHTVSGYTRHLAINGSDTIIFGLPNWGTGSALPMRTVATAVVRAAAAPGDDEILLLRPGNYNEQLTISTPCTLRATRKGSAVIGRP